MACLCWENLVGTPLLTCTKPTFNIKVASLEMSDGGIGDSSSYTHAETSIITMHVGTEKYSKKIPISHYSKNQEYMGKKNSFTFSAFLSSIAAQLSAKRDHSAYDFSHGAEGKEGVSASLWNNVHGAHFCLVPPRSLRKLARLNSLVGTRSREVGWELTANEHEEQNPPMEPSDSSKCPAHEVNEMSDLQSLQNWPKGSQEMEHPTTADSAYSQNSACKPLRIVCMSL